jgi:hypothetical protein
MGAVRGGCGLPRAPQGGAPGCQVAKTHFLAHTGRAPVAPAPQGAFLSPRQNAFAEGIRLPNSRFRQGLGKLARRVWARLRKAHSRQGPSRCLLIWAKSEFRPTPGAGSPALARARQPASPPRHSSRRPPSHSRAATARARAAAALAILCAMSRVMRESYAGIDYMRAFRACWMRAPSHPLCRPAAPERASALSIALTPPLKTAVILNRRARLAWCAAGRSGYRSLQRPVAARRWSPRRPGERPR